MRSTSECLQCITTHVRVPGTLVGAAVGAVAGAVALVLACTLGAGFQIDLGLAALVRGAYPLERSGEETFWWTARNVSVDLAGLDRRLAWSCAIWLRGAREDPTTLPRVSIEVDGVTQAALSTTNEYQQLSFDIPPRPESGTVLTLVSSNTFRPGPSDGRTLAVRVRSWSCAPSRTALVLPPWNAWLWATAATALLGAGFGLIGWIPAQLAAGVGLLAVGQAVIVTRGLGAFAPYAGRVPWIALWSAIGLAAAVRFLERRAGHSLHAIDRLVVTFAISSLYLKLLALLHPSKAIGDALFHAHRLEWVLDGRFYFTQPLAAGLEFPYAIGLYLFAAPWSMLTHDHVMLLRVVVSVWEAAAGALLYVMVVRTSGDRLAGVAAVVLFALVPLSYSIVGYGMLTNAFGRAVALTAVATTAIWPLRPRDPARVLAFTCLTVLAMLSHVSTFALLLTTLVAIGALFRRCGDRSTRDSSRVILVAAAIAAVFSVAAYYGHFGNTYLRVLRARSEHTMPIAPSLPSPTHEPNLRTNQMPSPTSSSPSLYARTAAAMTLTGTAVGWPILILGAIGAGRLWKEHARDPLSLVIVAWGLSYLAFLVVGIASPVDAPNQRYAAEFVERVVYVTCPAAVLLAARGGAWAWRKGPLLRVAVVALGLGATTLGVNAWLGWVR